jgi:hypothetical protein
MGRPSHHISLTIGVQGPEQWNYVYGLMNSVAANLPGEDFGDIPYVSLSSSLVDDDDLEPDPDHLFCDERTILKVLGLFTRHTGLSEESARELMMEMANAGILFRERQSER